MKVLTIVFFAFLFSINLFSQDASLYVQGKVVNSNTFEVLPFANIQLDGSNRGWTTDINGEFKLESVDENEEIVVSYVGFRSKSIKLSSIEDQDNLIIALLPIEIDLQEVTVYSKYTSASDEIQSSNLSIQSKRIREIAAAMPDILRSVQSLPGVITNNEFKADFNVRGGSQDENLIVVNGTKVYEPYHIKEVPNASVGIFNVDLVKKVDIITGGFPARYGDKMSSVLKIDYREGSKDKYSGSASLSLAYLDGYVEGPINENSSFIFGARKSYMEYVISMIDYEDISSVNPSFYDLQGVLSYSISPQTKLLFEFIHAGDDFSYDPERISFLKRENERNRANYFSTLFDFKVKNILSSKALLDFEISFYDQLDEENRLFLRNERINNEQYNNLFTQRLTYDSLRIKTFEYRTDLQYQVSQKYDIRTGLSYQLLKYEQNANDLWTYIGDRVGTDPILQDTLVRRGQYGPDEPVDIGSYKYSGYLENIISVTNSLTLNIGGRFDFFDINQDLTYSPRINAGYRFNDGTLLKFAWGHFYQSPIYDQLEYSTPSDTNTQSQKSVHYIIGLERQFSLSKSNYIKLKLDAYYKDYSELISSSFGVFERLTYSRKNDAEGNSKGIDLYTVLNYGDFYGWLSYGYLVAEENNLEDNIGYYPRYTNQTHTIAFVSNYYLGKNWNIGVKAYYGSGFPYTPREAVKDPDTGIWEWNYGETHSADLPDYKRVDLRISKDFLFDGFQLNTFIDVSNVFNFKNVHRYEFDEPGFTKPKREEIELWPILPSFGIRVLFN